MCTITLFTYCIISPSTAALTTQSCHVTSGDLEYKAF